MNIQAFKKRFDPVLLRYIEERIARYNAQCPDPDLARNHEHVLTLLRGGGKRIRPYIACTVYEMLGGRVTSPILELFSALELFHLFALVHDDIIDHGSERHGVPTLHMFARASLQKQHRLGDLAHVADGQAMLLGDFLHATANHLIARGVRADASRLTRLREEFDCMVQEVMLGEALDVDVATRREVSHELIERKMYLKTASYTFIRPMRMGAALGGGSVSFRAFCDAFGAALGMAFQIQDDLLDLTASAKTVHKTIFSDLREHQHTVFTQFIFERGSSNERAELATLMGADLTEADRDRVERLFHDSGSLAHGRALMNRYFLLAEQALEELRLSEVRKRPLRDLLIYICDRVC